MSARSDLSAYLSPEHREATLKRLAQKVGAELLAVGSSVAGRAICAARVPTLSSTSEPQRVLLTGAIHGLELVATSVALGFLDQLDQPHSPIHALRCRAEIWVVPCLNPDGYAQTWSARGNGSLKQFRANGHGVDLNRNFPLPAAQKPPRVSLGGWATGSRDPASPFYSGPHPLSEPETQAMAQLFDRTHFHAGVNLHSFMGRLLPPLVHDAWQARAYQQLAHAFGLGQPVCRYPRLSWGRWDRFTGELEDFQHHQHGTWAIDAEIVPLRRALPRPDLFSRFNPPQPEKWVQNDVPGLVAFFLAALSLPPPHASRAQRLRPSSIGALRSAS